MIHYNRISDKIFLIACIVFLCLLFFASGAEPANASHLCSQVNPYLVWEAGPPNGGTYNEGAGIYLQWRLAAQNCLNAHGGATLTALYDGAVVCSTTFPGGLFTNYEKSSPSASCWMTANGAGAHTITITAQFSHCCCAGNRSFYLSASRTIYVIGRPPAPAVDISANGSQGPITVPDGSDVNLTWTSSNTNSCNASGAWSGSKATNGSQATGVLSGPQAYTYSLTCSGSGGSRSDNVVVNVDAPVGPINDLRVDGGHHNAAVDGSSPLIKKSGETVYFTWSSNNVNNCWAWGGDENWWDADGDGNGLSPMANTKGNHNASQTTGREYVLPTVTSNQTYEFKFSCAASVSQAWWKQFSFLGFLKQVFAQTGDANDSVFVTVTPPNRAPVVNAGPNHSVTTGSAHTHTGATATDPDGNLASYEWSFVSCPGTCPALSSRTGSISGSSATVSGPQFTPQDAGNYVLRLTVTDADGATGTDTATDNAECPTCPDASVSASPPLVTEGSSATLQWNCGNSTQGTINQGVGVICSSVASCAAGGTTEVFPTDTTTYTLTCTDETTDDTDTATVTVGRIIED